MIALAALGCKRLLAAHAIKSRSIASETAPFRRSFLGAGAPGRKIDTYADVWQLAEGNSAAVGAALRAYHAARLADGESIARDDVVSGFTEPAAGSEVRPVREHVATYRTLSSIYAERERAALASTSAEAP